MYPLLACAEVAGLPITSLFRETPLLAIWKSADCGQAVEEVYRRPSQVVYSVVPSGFLLMETKRTRQGETHGCNTEM